MDEGGHSAEVGALDLGPREEGLRLAFADDAAFLEHVGPVGNSIAIATFCSTSSTAMPSSLMRRTAASMAPTIERRKAERRLVEKEQARPRHQRTRDRDHLLLAARELAGRAGELVLERREERERGGERLAPMRLGARQVAAELEVLAHRHAGEEAPPLRHDGDARRAEAMRRQARDVAAVKDEAAGARALDAGDGVDQRRLAGAVRADDREQLAGTNLDRDAPERRRRAVRDLEVAHFKQRLGRRRKGARAHGRAAATAAVPR